LREFDGEVAQALLEPLFGTRREPAPLVVEVAALAPRDFELLRGHAAIALERGSLLAQLVVTNRQLRERRFILAFATV